MSNKHTPVILYVGCNSRILGHLRELEIALAVADLSKDVVVVDSNTRLHLNSLEDINEMALLPITSRVDFNEVPSLYSFVKEDNRDRNRVWRESLRTANQKGKVRSKRR